MLNLNWIPLKSILNFFKLIFIFKCLKSQNGMFLYLIPITHTYSTRHSQCFIVPHVKTNYGKLAFSHWGACLWNKLDLKQRNSPNLPMFKKLIS